LGQRNITNFGGEDNTARLYSVRRSEIKGEAYKQPREAKANRGQEGEKKRKKQEGLPPGKAREAQQEGWLWGRKIRKGVQETSTVGKRRSFLVV